MQVGGGNGTGQCLTVIVVCLLAPVVIWLMA